MYGGRKMIRYQLYTENERDLSNSGKNSLNKSETSFVKVKKNFDKKIKEKNNRKSVRINANDKKELKAVKKTSIMYKKKDRKRQDE